MSLRISFVGAGQMATALASGLCQSGVSRAESIAACDPDEGARQRFARAIPGTIVSSDAADVTRRADVLFLAVKPAVVPLVLPDVSDSLAEDTLVVSIAAGVRLERLQEGLPERARVIRVMPNTPCLVRMSASVFSVGRYATEKDAQCVQTLLEAVGLALQLPEALLDAVTGLSGSGPAFVYSVIEALSDGGVLMGLPRQVATTLAAQTVRGAAEMVLQSDDHPAVLREAVTSPGGTTIAGLQAAEDGGLRAALMQAVQAATQRAKELAGS